MKKLRIGINGFGRIGRIAARIILQREDLTLCAINSRADSSSHAYLLKYDSTYPTLQHDIKAEKDAIVIDGQSVAVFQKDSPQDILWNSSQIDVVIDATGKYRTTQELKGHLENGAKKVVLSSPAKDDMKTFIFGVNHTEFDSAVDTIISNSSCTTNCLATTLSVLDEAFKVTEGFMTTIHAVTDSQNILDNSHLKEPRLRRCALASMIPSSTGSAKDISKIFPHLSGKLICQSVRIPLQTVSMIILSVRLEKESSVDLINKTFEDASLGNLKGILAVTKEELVSKDFTGNAHSAIVDTFLTKVLSSNFATIYAWYDNEFGYASRLVDMVSYVGKDIQ